MIRPFFVGALAGFFFGSSKQGQQLRQNIDDMFTDLLSTDNKEKVDRVKDGIASAQQNVSKVLSSVQGKSGESTKSANKNGAGSNSAKNDDRQNGAKKVEAKDESTEKLNKHESVRDSEADKSGSAEKPKESSETSQSAASQEPGPLDVEMAQALADKLGAKPIAPEDENLAAFHAGEDQLKSA
jgi:hypothetical protein